MAPRRDSTGHPDDGKSASGLSSLTALENAKEYLRLMTGRDCEMVSGLHRSGDGWTIKLEVLELERIPPTTDVLGSYAIDLDANGELISCERTRRYYRNQADEFGE